MIREAWRLNIPSLQEHLQQDADSLAVFIIYTGNEIPNYREVEGKIKLVIKKLKDKTRRKG